MGELIELPRPVGYRGEYIALPKRDGALDILATILAITLAVPGFLVALLAYGILGIPVACAWDIIPFLRGRIRSVKRNCSRAGDIVIMLLGFAGLVPMWISSVVRSCKERQKNRAKRAGPQ